MEYHTDLLDNNQLFHKRYKFPDLKALLAKASPLRSGDQLAGIAADTEEERVAAQMILADLPLKQFLEEPILPYNEDEVTRLIIDKQDQKSFSKIKSHTIGEFRDWLLSFETQKEELVDIKNAITPEIAAAVSKIMSNQDLILVASKCENVTKFRNTIGLSGHFSSRLQPNHPTDDPRGIMASILDGLLYGVGDAVIGINPATDNVKMVSELCYMLDELINKFSIPTQSCVLTHLTTILEVINKGIPVDLVFQSIGGTEATNKSFGVDLQLLQETKDAALSLNRAQGNNVFYFETGQGSSLSADAHHGIDQQTCEARAYAVAREFDPLLVNTVVGFIGPEYLYDGKQISRAGLEDHFCGKIMGLPMGVDICYTNHAKADQDDMDSLLTNLAVAGCTYVMGVPGADDIMLNYQSTSFHDIAYVRQVLKKPPAPEFLEWLNTMGIVNNQLQIQQVDTTSSLLGIGTLY